MIQRPVFFALINIPEGFRSMQMAIQHMVKPMLSDPSRDLRLLIFFVDGRIMHRYDPYPACRIADGCKRVVQSAHLPLEYPPILLGKIRALRNHPASRAGEALPAGVPATDTCVPCT